MAKIARQRKKDAGQDAEMQDNLQNQGQLASLSAITSQDHLFYV